jgi:hypothetical protein
MKKMLTLIPALLLFFLAPFFSAAQTTEEQIESGRFGTGEPVSVGAVEDGKSTYTNRWLFLGIRLGPSLRSYTPSGDTAFTGGDTNAASLDAAIQGTLQIVPLFSIQAEAVFNWDNATVWQYASNPVNANDVDRYTREFSGFSLQFPIMAKLNFYPGTFRISPFFGTYVLVPLGDIKTSSPLDRTKSFSPTYSSYMGLLGGLNAAYPLSSGYIFVDIRYSADLGEPELGNSDIKTYRRHSMSICLGYEFGLFKKR